LEDEQFPHSPVADISNDRHYIVINPIQWVWKKVQWKKKVLNYHKLPTANNLILLKDLRGGSDGRVWLACYTSGLVCTLKFAHFLEGKNRRDILELPEARKRLEHEVEMHLQQGVEAKLLELCSRPVMMMPPFKPIDFTQLNAAEKKLIRDSITSLAVEHRLFHGDMSNRHVLRATPTKEIRVVDMTSARKIEDDEDAEELANEMISRLEF